MNEFEESLCSINTLILLRKEVPSKISDIYDRMTLHILKNLRSVNIQLESKEINWEIPNNLFEELNTEHYDAKICDQIKTLKILMRMKNNPVSKIIDDI